jgi:hypothetical protein
MTLKENYDDCELATTKKKKKKQAKLKSHCGVRARKVYAKSMRMINE